MKYIVYCTRNNKNSKIYIGVHQTIDPFEFDGYLGCGIYTTSKSKKPVTAFHSAIVKYGASNFTRTTLAIFDTEVDAYALESILVTKDFVRRRDTYNMIPGASSGFVNPKRPVRQFDLEGAEIAIFDSLEEAGSFIGEEYMTVAKACTTSNLTLKGSYWRYLSPSRNELCDINHIVHGSSKELAVIQYSKAGYKMKSWDSIQQAAKTFNCDKSSISKSCRCDVGRITTGGYQWRYASDNVEQLPAVKTSGGDSRKIVRLSPDNILLETYNSITEAEIKSGLSKVSIHKALKQNKISGGFRWQYV